MANEMIVASNSMAMSAMQTCEQYAQIEKMGAVIAKSGVLGAITPSVGVTAALTCAQEGISLVQFKAKYHVMGDGNITVKTNWMQAKFQDLGGKIHINEFTPEVCDLDFTFDGETMNNRVTLKEFKENGVAVNAAGRVKDNWRKFPKDMLWARCCAGAIRKLCPQALGGLYVQEEAQDFGNSAPARAAVVSASPSPIAAESVDANICPCGKNKGKNWSELDTAVLQAVVDNAEKFPAITAAHLDAIREEMDMRDRAEAEQTAERVEAEVVE